MSKYNKFQRGPQKSRNTIHPVWTGIGCIMILVVPIMSWAAAVELVGFAKAQGWPVMRELSGYVHLPDIFYNLPLISTVANYISTIPDFSGVALFFLVILLLLSGLLSFVYAMIYRVVGPPRYLADDAPAQRVSTKRYKR
jgi:hypothetical protein